MPGWVGIQGVLLLDRGEGECGREEGLYEGKIGIGAEIGMKRE